MRIGVDAREICGQTTGVGRWLAMLLREWMAGGIAHQFVLYAPEPIGIALDPDRASERIVPGGRGTAWEQTQLPRAAAADRLDVFFAPGYTAPLQLGVPFVALIHDVSFEAHPEWFTRREGIRRRLLTRRTAHAACAVVTVSEFSAREIVDRLGIPPHRVHVVLPGIEPPEAQRERTSREPRVLYVGSIFNRRRVPGLINAFARLASRHPEASLDIVGDNRTHPRQDIRAAISRSGVQDRIRWHEYIENDRLAELYASARAFAFFSEYEGLGLTPLEALSAGVPPALLDTEIARESCGDAALYVHRDDARGVTGALESLLFDEQVSRRVLAAAPATLARYSWPRAAREVMQVLEACASR
jgi:glycosyltransferase involved in cell wall biosynthesis